MCFDCLKKLVRPLGISRWKNITPEVDCGADRFAGELLYERDRKALDKRAALGLSLARALASAWQAVNAKVNDLNAAKEFGTLPDMTSWAVNVLI